LRYSGITFGLFSPLAAVASCRPLSVGDRVRLKRCFNAKDVEAFAHTTGDTNPIHLDPDFAKQSIFKRCVVHGALTVGLVSCLLGTHFPGPGCILQRLEFQFVAPLFVGELCQVDAEVTHISGTRVVFGIHAFALERDTCIMKGNVHLVVTKEQLCIKPPAHLRIADGNNA
ncbi:hypothetical protein T265_12458, partial [Opisthorchis viverrini]